MLDYSFPHAMTTMPRFVAYICPRTEQLFKDKSTYVTHLRDLAREFITAKKIARETNILRLDFENLRLSATSQLDVLNWLMDNSSEIIRVACIIRSDLVSNLDKMKNQAADRGFVCSQMTVQTAGLGGQADVELVVPFISRHSGPLLVVGSTSFLPVVKGRSAFMEAAATFLGEMRGITTHLGATKDLYLSMYAEDWTFVASRVLYAHRRHMEDIELDYSLERIISRRFPHITFEGYRGLCKSGLLEDDILGEPALTNWLHQGGEAAVQLPALYGGDPSKD
jgi:hypothetical protein